MKAEENVFITLQIQKNKAKKKFVLNVEFDKSSPNFSINNDTIIWSPTAEELDVIAEAFEILNFSQDAFEKAPQQKNHSNLKQKSETSKVYEEFSESKESKNSKEFQAFEEQKPVPQSSSEIRIPPPPDDNMLETRTDDQDPSMRKETDEKIFVQADDKTIDELLKRRKVHTEDQSGIESGDKVLIDQMLKQKKKKIL